MTKFDPTPGVAYGECVTCGIVLETDDDAKAHRAATMGAGGRRSHSTRGVNPTREDRIQSWADGLVEDAISNALDNLRDEVARANVSWDEVYEALTWHSEFADEWKRKP